MLMQTQKKRRQLTDSFVESRLFEFQGPESPLRPAYDMYERRILCRQMFRLLADFDVPPDMNFSAYSGEQIIQKTLENYRYLHTSGEMVTLVESDEKCEIQELDAKLFRCSIAPTTACIKYHAPRGT